MPRPPESRVVDLPPRDLPPSGVELIQKSSKKWKYFFLFLIVLFIILFATYIFLVWTLGWEWDIIKITNIFKTDETVGCEINSSDKKETQLKKCLYNKSVCSFNKNTCEVSGNTKKCEDLNSSDYFNQISDKETTCSNLSNYINPGTLCKYKENSCSLEKCTGPYEINGDICKANYDNYEYIYIKDNKFYKNKTEIIFKGLNIVLKGHPWLPVSNSTTSCDISCTEISQCYTFGIEDIKKIKEYGYNSIRLGISWQGAEQKQGTIDPEFKNRLKNILKLCDEENIYVLLDNHGDQWAPQSCGFGLPDWLVDQALSGSNYTYKGKGLKPSELSNNIMKFYNKINDLDDDSLKGQMTELLASLEKIGITEDTLSLGDENADRSGKYYMGDDCNEHNGGSNNNKLGFTQISQIALNYVFNTDAGRALFIGYWKLIIGIVKKYKCIIGCELINEPPYINRKAYFETVVELDKEIKKDDTIERGILIGFSELYSGLMYNKNILKYINPLSDELIEEYDYLKYYVINDIDNSRLGALKFVINILSYFTNNLNYVNRIIDKKENFNKIKSYITSNDFKNLFKELINFIVDKETTEYIKNSDNFFLCWHDYSTTRDDFPELDTIIEGYTNYFNCGNIMSESTHCDIINHLQDNKKNSTFKWKYQAYCSSSPVCIDSDGQLKNHDECGDGDTNLQSFGACILGWGNSYGLLSCEDKENVCNWGGGTKRDAELDDNFDFSILYSYIQ